MARSLNRVQLIGNLTRDPELRYTPNGTAVCSFGLATNRSWKTDNGEKHDEAEFHNIVSWNKLAELCSQFLVKGRKVFVEGRLATRTWTGQDGAQRNKTEIVISDMILLDSRHQSGAVVSSEPAESVPAAEKIANTEVTEKSTEVQKSELSASGKLSDSAVAREEKIVAEGPTASNPVPGGTGSNPAETEEVVPDDIPF